VRAESGETHSYITTNESQSTRDQDSLPRVVHDDCSLVYRFRGWLPDLVGIFLLGRLEGAEGFGEDDGAEREAGAAAVEVAGMALDACPGGADIAVGGGGIGVVGIAPIGDAGEELDEGGDEAALVGEEEVNEAGLAAELLGDGGGAGGGVDGEEGFGGAAGGERVADGGEEGSEARGEAAEGAADRVAIEDIDGELVDIVADDGLGGGPDEEGQGEGAILPVDGGEEDGEGGGADDFLEAEGHGLVDGGIAAGAFGGGGGKAGGDGNEVRAGEDGQRGAVSGDGAEGENDGLLEGEGSVGGLIKAGDGVEAARGRGVEGEGPGGEEGRLAGRGQVEFDGAIGSERRGGGDGLAGGWREAIEGGEGGGNGQLETARRGLADPMQVNLGGRVASSRHKVFQRPDFSSGGKAEGRMGRGGAGGRVDLSAV
jgi:hypothetical protein